MNVVKTSYFSCDISSSSHLSLTWISVAKKNPSFIILTTSIALGHDLSVPFNDITSLLEKNSVESIMYTFHFNNMSCLNSSKDELVIFPAIKFPENFIAVSDQSKMYSVELAMCKTMTGPHYYFSSQLNPPIQWALDFAGICGRWSYMCWSFSMAVCHFSS